LTGAAYQNKAALFTDKKKILHKSLVVTTLQNLKKKQTKQNKHIKLIRIDFNISNYLEF
jgi:hypothetical protein